MTFLMFGVMGWDGVWYSRHHLTVRLARRHRVVLVDPPDSWRSVGRSPRRLFRRGGVLTDASGLARFHPPGWLPEVARWAGLRRTLHRWRARSLLRAADSGDAGRTICYVWNPAYQEAVVPLDSLPLVYHCYDKYDRYTDAPSEQIGLWETWLARRAAVCVAASTKLGEHLRELGAHRVHVLRHGVDPDVFRPGLPVPAALAGIPRPRIGVAARLNEGLDVDTLLTVAGRRPDWSLVLIGGVYFTDPARRRGFDELCGLPNVHHVGLQPPSTMPAWLSGLDVALACYDLATWGPYNQPLKIYEYLACGLPVVCSDIVATKELGELVERCGTAAAWEPAIERALVAQSADVVERRVAFSRANSWEQRVAELEEALGTLTA